MTLVTLAVNAVAWDVLDLNHGERLRVSISYALFTILFLQITKYDSCGLGNLKVEQPLSCDNKELKK